MPPPWKRCLLNSLALLVTGAVFIPVGAYLVGRFVIGPYEGEHGLAGYLEMIYWSAWHGKQAALMLILGPMLIVGTWLVGLRISRYKRPGAKSETP